MRQKNFVNFFIFFAILLLVVGFGVFAYLKFNLKFKLPRFLANNSQQQFNIEPQSVADKTGNNITFSTKTDFAKSTPYFDFLKNSPIRDDEISVIITSDVLNAVNKFDKKGNLISGFKVTEGNGQIVIYIYLSPEALDEKNLSFELSRNYLSAIIAVSEYKRTQIDPNYSQNLEEGYKIVTDSVVASYDENKYPLIIKINK